MAESPIEQDARERFREQYSRPGSAAARRLEETVFGRDIGNNGYTTLEQAEGLARHLELTRETRLLDLGSGRGWPGSVLAKSSGCSMVATDVPVEALHAAERYLRVDGSRQRIHRVAADGRALPLPPRWFDAVVHSDVFC